MYALIVFMTRALQNTPSHDNHRLCRLSLYQNNGFMQYNYHTINIIAHCYCIEKGIWVCDQILLKRFKSHIGQNQTNTASG